jgi:hypothetical protein
MAERQRRTRMTKMALCVSMFVYFAFVVSSGQAEASGCGDYLHHTLKRVFSDSTNDPQDSQPLPTCKGGNCRSAPSLPPVEQTRIVVTHKQPFVLRTTEDDDSVSKSQGLELFDEVLPLSATLEVLTPPPIFAV